MRALFLSFMMMVAVADVALSQGTTSLCQPGPNSGIGNSCAERSIPISTAASAVASSMVLKAAAGTVSGFQVNNTNAGARWVILFNASAAPSNGAKTQCASASPADGCVAKWYQVGGNSTLGVMWSPGPPLSLSNGVVLTCSSTGPFTLTLAADCTFSGEVN